MFPRRVPENLAAANAGAWRCQVPPRFSTRLCGVQGWDSGGDDLPDGHGIRCRQDTIHRHDIRVGIGALLEAVISSQTVPWTALVDAYEGFACVYVVLYRCPSRNLVWFNVVRVAAL